MQGILLVDKPKGWTSFDAVNYVRSIIAKNEKIRPRQVKVGHIGTLDPLATGLLVLLIGKSYTKKAASLSNLDKVYRVEAKLGQTSDSLDSETESRFFSDYVPTNKEIGTNLDSMIGKTMQIPPNYSAIKVNGKRSYKLARQGIEMKLEARPIEIHKIKILSYKYPILKIEADVSSGTYIRSIVKDLGVKLGCGAYMTALDRREVGNFELKNALQLKHLSVDDIQKNLLTL